MAYVKKTWKARQGAGLNKYTDSVSGQVFELQNTPDSISQVGDAFTAANMNDLENRIDAGKVDKIAGKGLSTNDYTDEDKAKVDAINQSADKLELNDGEGNTLTLDADGDLLVDTTRTSPIDPSTSGKTLGYKAAFDTLSDYGNNTRGATVKLTRRLSGVDQAFVSYMLTTGMVEIRVGTTAALNGSSNVTTTFSNAMSGVPQIVLLQPKTGKAGIASPKIASKSATGFAAILGGSTGTDTVCDYLAIRFNYMTHTV